MVDRVPCDSRTGAASYETDRNHNLAPRMIVRYRIEFGEIFKVPFADDAKVPGEWLYRNGQVGELVEDEGTEAKPVKPPRTHWGILRERRPIEEPDVLPDERADLLHKHRRNAVRLLEAQREVEEAGGGA